MPAMSKNVIYQGQSFLDKVVECTGDIDNAFVMSLLNGFSMTDNRDIGETILAPVPTRKAIVSVFTEKNRPATANKYVDDIIEIYEFPLGEFPISF